MSAIRTSGRHAWLAAAGLIWVCAVPLSAFASEGIYLNWNDCPLGASAASNLVNACDSNLGQGELLCSFSLAQPVDSVIAVEITLAVQHADAALPPWWRFDQTPCRSGSLNADASFGATCEDMWSGEATSGGLAQYTVGEPRGGLNQARIRVTLAVPLDRMQSLGTAATYYAARLVLDNAATIGAQPCAGCGTPACVVLNTILIGRPPRPLGAPSSDVLLETPGAGHPNWVTWQGGVGASCGAVPVRRTTWGEVKALYR